MVSARTKSKSLLLAGVAIVLGSSQVSGFSTTTSARTTSSASTTRNSIPALFASKDDQPTLIANPLAGESTATTQQRSTPAAGLAVGLALALSTATTTLPANAYIPSDYASETVQTAIKDLKAASGNAKSTFDVYEGIAAIITEGKGVGGQINYSKYSADSLDEK